MAVKIDRTTTAAGAYPLMLASYLIACPTYDDAKTADLVKGFLTYVVSDRGPAGRGRQRRLGAAPGVARSRRKAAARSVDIDRRSKGSTGAQHTS